MNAEYKDFIGVFSNVFSQDFCEHIIKEFEKKITFGCGTDRQKGEGVDKHLKEDYSINLNGVNLGFESFNEKSVVPLFFEGLQNCYEAYSEKFSVIKHTRVNCKNIKLQKTSTGGGYHVWHGEQGNDEQAARSLVYMLYLNSLPKEANGETEFLYQQRRINPVGNTMVLWPAAFTHAHRGNPVYGNHSKYVVTGWFYNE